MLTRNFFISVKYFSSNCIMSSTLWMSQIISEPSVDAKGSLFSARQWSLTTKLVHDTCPATSTRCRATLPVAASRPIWWGPLPGTEGVTVTVLKAFPSSLPSVCFWPDLPLRSVSSIERSRRRPPVGVVNEFRTTKTSWKMFRTECLICSGGVGHHLIHPYSYPSLYIYQSKAEKAFLAEHLNQILWYFLSFWTIQILIFVFDSNIWSKTHVCRKHSMKNYISCILKFLRNSGWKPLLYFALHCISLSHTWYMIYEIALSNSKQFLVWASSERSFLQNIKLRLILDSSERNCEQLFSLSLMIKLIN